MESKITGCTFFKATILFNKRSNAVWLVFGPCAAIGVVPRNVFCDIMIKRERKKASTVSYKQASIQARVSSGKQLHAYNHTAGTYIEAKIKF